VLDLLHYQREDGSFPFRTWMEQMRDKLAKARIAMRLRQLEEGNLGDAKSVGEGILELRIHVGAGYRVYCGRHGQRWIILLCGGDKCSQSKDIERARSYWSDWKRRQS
jgi:putative addiction module killer protein